uniref:Na+/H+ exchange regulatory cofactor NHE-RF2 n=1 Tax=Caligus clemensi TaxID=344056 RepID=C1C386_CALCM|nr:Na+/H+ exchange regulatory cofactor NHE-RF2 [Caligus clemensi]
MVKIEGKPRLCKLTMWSDFDGYGFNLHAEKSRPGQYVGKVDDGSPAGAAGLREGDRIIEVNGFNISSENHKHVVSRIKSIPNETDLLVVDKETDRIYGESGLVISSEDAIDISSAREEVATEDEDRKSLESNDSSIDKVEVRHHAMGSTGNSPSPRSTPSPQFSSHSPEVLSEVSSPVNGGVASELDDLNLNMTAAEMRERISSKKKRDPRKDDRMDILRKYQIIQTL